MPAMVKIEEVDAWEADKPKEGQSLYMMWPHQTEVSREVYTQISFGKWMDRAYELGLLSKDEDEAVDAGFFVQAMLKLRMAILQDIAERKSKGESHSGTDWLIWNDRIALKAPAWSDLYAMLSDDERKSLDFYK